MKKVFTTKADAPPDLVEFWNIWRPHMRSTDGRGDARDAFFKHIRAGVNPRDIVDGARYFLRTLRDRDREYIPLAASWLNKRAYEDLAEVERSYQLRVGASNSNVAQASPARAEYIAAELRRAERSFR